jgi:DNA repair protein RadC
MKVCESAVATYGANTVSTGDLLQVLGLPHGWSLEEILRGSTAGMKPKERTRAEALAELMRRKEQPPERPRITSPKAAGAYLLPRCTGWTEERFGLLALNARGDLLAERILATGTATALMISPREFFREGLRLGASTVIAFHNHPSGDPTPSKEDIQITRRLRTAGESLGVPLSDHIVVGGDKYHSFRAAESWDAK